MRLKKNVGYIDFVLIFKGRGVVSWIWEGALGQKSSSFEFPGTAPLCPLFLE